jgi:hypothetical protein
VRVLGLVVMFKDRWRSPTPAEIKRAIKASLDLGLTVTGYRVDAHGISITAVPPSADAPPTSSANEWDDAA